MTRNDIVRALNEEYDRLEQEAAGNAGKFRALAEERQAKLREAAKESHFPQAIYLDNCLPGGYNKKWIGLLSPRC